MAAATTATAAAMAAVLPKLSALLLLKGEEGEDGRGFIINGGARRDATFLRDEIQGLRCFMEKKHNSLGSGYLLKKQEEGAWMQCPMWRELRAVLSDIEDSVDAFVRRCHRATMTAAKAPPRRGLTGKAVLDLAATAMVRHRFAAQLRGFRSRLEELDPWRLRLSYSVHNSNCTQRQAQAAIAPRPMTYHEIKRSRPLRDADEAGLAATMGRWRDEVAGQLLLAGVGEGGEDDERAARRLKDISISFFESIPRHSPFPFHNENTRVVAICGSRGMGTTTLAREVYRVIGGQFDRAAWVSAPPRRDMNDVLSSILGQVDEPHGGGGGGDGRWQRHLLVGRIRECLQHKRYLVVLDGISSKEAWETISGVLPHNDLGSRVLVTTSCVEFARSCSSGNGGAYYIKPLDFGDSWTLFHRRLFGADNACYPTLADVAYKIVEKCAGVPLATATVATLLARKPRSWSLWMHVHNSIPISKPWIVVRSIPSLAYHNLPRHLTLCLWHLGVFPADHPIDHGRVMRSWMAEGIVQEKHGKTAEEVAHSYLDELMDWNMIQPDHGAKTKAYLISDLVLELIRSQSVEGNFVTILDRKPVSALPSKIRRLSVVRLFAAAACKAA
ncbi:unnamed protein product [Urochloa humidicola]